MTVRFPFYQDGARQCERSGDYDKAMTYRKKEWTHGDDLG